MKLNFFPLLLVILCSFKNSNAQENQVSVETVLDQVSHKNIKGLFDKTTEAVYKFYYEQPVASNLINEKCIVVTSSLDEVAINCNEDSALRALRNLNPFRFLPAKDTLVVYMETYEDDKGMLCEHDKSDDFFSMTPFKIKLANLAPGVFSDTMRIVSTNKKFEALIRIRYSIPDPTPLSSPDVDTVNEVSRRLTLQSGVGLANKNGLISNWEYKTDVDSAWSKLVDTALMESITFNPLTDLFKKPIKTNSSLSLRMKLVSPGLSSGFTPEYHITLTPEKPSVDTNGIRAIPTCADQPSGKLRIKQVHSAADSIVYTISRLDPVAGQLPSNATGSFMRTGTIASGGEMATDSLPEGRYMVRLFNAGMATGTVAASFDFGIGRYERLSITSVKLQDPSCNSVSDGSIRIETTGGNPDKLSFAMSPQAGTLEEAERHAIFSGLPFGEYIVFVRDECGQSISTQKIILHKKTSITGLDLAIKNETDQKQGSVNITLRGNDLKGYKYMLFKQLQVVTEQQLDTSSFSIDRLTEGTYKLRICDAASGNCAALDTSFTIMKENLAVVETQQPTTVITAPAIAADTTPPGSRLIASDTLANNISTPPATGEVISTPPNGVSPGINNMDAQRSFFGVSERKCTVYAPLPTVTVKKDDFYIVIEKSSYLMSIYDSHDKLVASYPVVFGLSGNLNDKMCAGDNETPEGIFKIASKRAHEKWDKILLLDYPTKECVKAFKERKAKGLLPANAVLGGGVGLHGTWPGDDITIDRKQNWTEGCVSTKNSYIDDIYSFVPVGTKVIIKK
jgi:lipoprotein-anchoring transpeptidase ErfK/SrfK